ncbi:MAG: gliding motility-associated C-terminal domain-containing protein [Fluviicola sp.]
MRKYILPILTALALPFASDAQVCNVSVAPEDTIICPGDSVLVTSIASITSSGQSFNFDFGVLPPGWSTSGGSTFSQPCGPGINNTPYYWASTSGGGTPQINSPAFDVSCGGFITFDMVYAVQGGSAPCEGPDLAHEGVELQYSTDGGLTWLPIVYYSPGGFELPQNPGTSGSVASGQTPYTVWNSFSVPIPPGAQTTGTEFQWIQENSSGTCCDNWGVDNIVIAAGPCNSAWVDWDNDAQQDSNDFYWTPTTDTFFVADVYDSLGNYACTSDTVFISVYQNTMTYDLVDTVFAYCPFDTLPAAVTNVQNAPGPFGYSWTTGSTTDSTLLGAGAAQQSQTTYYVDVTDGCGFVVTDSVVLDVNQTLSIDSFFVQNANACNPTGAASAFFSGDSTNQQQGLNWFFEGPGQPGANQVNASVITNVPSGWYYVTLTDAVCTVQDSVFIDIDQPPVAQFTPGSANGCAPVIVDFVNSSQNTVNYTWVFGDGSPNANTVDASHTFTQTSTVMLIASDASGCADTAYAQIDVVPCGCTDPSAINFNPFATIDDGSCIFPDPIVDPANVFTPDGDPNNNMFYLNTENVQELTLVITNRWGNLMYEGKGPNPQWDGTNQDGTDAEEGVYFYKYTAVGVIPEQIVEGHGFVHLIRNK